MATTTATKRFRGVLLPGLQTVREEQGLSRSELARRTGLDVTFLWRLEQMASGAGYATLKALARELSVPDATLTGESLSS